MHDEKGPIIIPWLMPWEAPRSVWFGKRDSLNITSHVPAKEKQKQRMMRGRAHPTAHTRIPQYLEFGRGDSQITVEFSSGKEREKQYTVRGTSHPTARTGRLIFYLIWEAALPQFSSQFLCKRNKYEMHDERAQMIVPWLIPWEDPKFLHCWEGDLLRSATPEPAKEK